MGNLHSLTLDLAAVVKKIPQLLGELCGETLRSRGDGPGAGAAIPGGAGSAAAAAPEPGAAGGDRGPARHSASVQQNLGHVDGSSCVRCFCSSRC